MIPQKGTPGSAAFSPGSAPSDCDRGGTASHFETFLPAAALWSTNTCMLPSHLVLSGHPIAIEFLGIFAGGLGPLCQREISPRVASIVSDRRASGQENFLEYFGK